MIFFRRFHDGSLAFLRRFDRKITTGYVVVEPNPRGSTGYGQKFIDEINGDWGVSPMTTSWP